MLNEEGHAGWSALLRLFAEEVVEDGGGDVVGDVCDEFVGFH